jgi:uncharacterized protein (TIGR01244 family)
MNKTILKPGLAIGAQPGPAELAQLKNEGFRSVVNLRMPEEASPLNPEQEGVEAQKLGMEYAHIPVSSQNLSPALADQFCEALSKLPQPVFVHCQGGTRAGAFALAHLGREAGWSGDQAFGEGEKAGYKCESPALQAFVRSYLEQR